MANLTGDNLYITGSGPETHATFHRSANHADKIEIGSWWINSTELLTICSSTLNINSAGGWKVGIGTSSPETKLHVYDSGADSEIRITSGNSSSSRLRFGRVEDTDEAYIGFNDGADLCFTADNSAGGQMWIKGATGNVGIGTQTPDTTLHIEHPTTTIDYYENKGLLISEAGSADGIVAFSRTDSECYIGLNKDLSSGSGYLGLGMNLDSNSNKQVALWIRESGNVGIGTAAPGAALEVAGISRVSRAASPTDHYLDTTIGDLSVTMNGYDSDGGVNWHLQSNGNEWLTYSYSTGDVTFAGDLVMADGKGIDFSADASPAAGMTAEILDDYEEGTWTPAFTLGSGTADSLTIQYAQYTKVGRQVYFTARIVVGAISSPSGSCVISGLPFTAQTFGPLAFTCTGLADTDDYIPQGVVEVGETFAYLRLFRDGDEANTMAAKLQVSSAFIINGMYNV